MLGSREYLRQLVRALPMGAAHEPRNRPGVTTLRRVVTRCGESRHLVMPLGETRKIVVHEIVRSVPIGIGEECGRAAAGAASYVFLGPADLSVGILQIVDAMERTFALLALGNSVECGMRVIPAVIADSQNSSRGG